MQQNSALTVTAPTTKIRKPWIDGLRAIAIIFVILGHQIADNIGFFVFTSPIKIPLFFMISGYLFKGKQTTFRKFFSGVLFGLVIPWFCLTIPLALIKVLNQGITALPKHFWELIAGKTAWYMPCCIIAEILFFLLIKFTKNLTGIIAGVLALFGMGILAVHFDILNFAMINRALIVQVFLLSGYLYKLYEEKLMAKISWVHISVLCCIYVVMGILSLIIWPDKCIDIHMNIYYNYPYCFAMIFLGCFTMFVLAEKLATTPPILKFIGQNTLVYYLLHNINIAVFDKALGFLNINLPQSFTDSIVYSIILTIIGCVACGIEAMLINRFIPEIAGKKRKAISKK